MTAKENLRNLKLKKFAAKVVELLLICILCPIHNATAASPPGESRKEKSTPEKSSTQEPESNQNKWQLEWNKGLIVQVPWDVLSMRIGGMAQNDTTGFVTDLKDYETAQGQFVNRVQWRWVALNVRGSLLKHFNYQVQYDFASRNPPKLKDAWIGIGELPLPIPIGFRFGRFRTMIGLEGYTPFRDTLFMERGLPYAFVPPRNTGFVVFGKLPKSIDWGAGFIKPESEFLYDDTGKYGFVASGARQFQNVEKGILHVGGNYQFQPSRDTFRFLSRPEAHLAPQLVDTGLIEARSDHFMLLEGAWVRSQLSLQAEYGWKWVRGDMDRGQQNVSFHGGYIAGSIFLTDDERTYLPQEGRFGQIIPKKPFGLDGGLGAWEVAFRYSHLDLDDRNIRGGILNDFTAALNWYPIDYLRFMFNSIYAKQNRLPGIWIFQARLQLSL